MVLGSGVKAISSLGVRSPWLGQSTDKVLFRLRVNNNKQIWIDILKLAEFARR